MIKDTFLMLWHQPGEIKLLIVYVVLWPSSSTMMEKKEGVNA